jgi:hypothetical protein
MRVRKYRVGFYNQLELFLVAALDNVYIRDQHSATQHNNSIEVVAAPCLDDV